jgi:5'-deoxynucleotidase YfbR-like HD superfamily hydrolase
MIESILATFSGRYLSFTNPKPEDIHIEDIAHALSNTCRFGGHTSRFYSVAQHCAIASRIVPVGFGLEALLHDAAEAYLGDVPTPLKQFLPELRRIEACIMHRISEKFNIPAVTSPEVKKIDRILLATERRDLLSEQELPWTILEGVEPLQGVINPLSPCSAKYQFLERYKEVTRNG